MTSSPMRVTKTIYIDAPGLGARIKAARESDPRPLTAICRAIDLSTNNWYRIEKEQQTLPEETLRKIEKVLDVDFGVDFD
jgi:transcriptional regulator with XRE-family HTH domain